MNRQSFIAHLATFERVLGTGQNSERASERRQNALCWCFQIWLESNEEPSDEVAVAIARRALRRKAVFGRERPQSVVSFSGEDLETEVVDHRSTKLCTLVRDTLDDMRPIERSLAAELANDGHPGQFVRAADTLGISPARVTQYKAMIRRHLEDVRCFS